MSESVSQGNPLVRLICSTRSVRARRPTIAEPATSLTDLALAGQTFLYADRLRRGPARNEAAARAWALAMAAAGVAALAGALTHAIYQDEEAQLLLYVRQVAWKVVGLATAAASAFMIAGSVAGSMRPGSRGRYLAAAGLKAAVAGAAGWRTGSFVFTILDYAASMLVVLSLQLRQWRSNAAAPWLAAGILVSFVAAAIQQSGFAIHRRFNHNDLYHVVQMGAFHLLYEGARREQDRRE